MLTKKLFLMSLLWCCLSSAQQSVAMEKPALNIRFAYIGDASNSALAGVQQGLIEANLQGQFLGQTYALDTFSVEALGEIDFSAYIAIISAIEEYDAFGQLNSTVLDVPIFNTTLADDRLRAMCLPHTLHVIPSTRMRADAIEQWRKKDADAQVTAQAWHKDFVKFAARDLNKRFKKTHQQAMDDYAWAGWAAVKMTSDSVARESITNGQDMLRYLRNDLSFDGQKGSNMTFRHTGQLRQLMLIIENGQIVAEAPVRGIATPATLDSLGLLDCE